jgi:hypothetical protein
MESHYPVKPPQKNTIPLAPPSTLIYVIPYSAGLEMQRSVSVCVGLIEVVLYFSTSNPIFQKKIVKIIQ